MKKLLSMLLTVFMLVSLTSFCCYAETTEDIKFEVLDENGNIVEVLDLVYIEEVAELYEEYKKQRAVQGFHDLSVEPYILSGREASMIIGGSYFNPSSSGNLYYNCEVTGVNGCINIYRNNGYSDGYVGTFALQSMGNNTYGRSGRFTHLNPSTYYQIGILSDGGNFTSYYASVSWN